MKSNTRPRNRDSWVDVVCPSGRQFITRVLDGEAWTPAQMRVALVIVHELALWSRLGDKLGLTAIAGKARLSERTVSRALHKWHDLGWLTYEPSRTKGVVSWLSLPEFSGDSHLSSETEFGATDDKLRVTATCHWGDTLGVRLPSYPSIPRANEHFCRAPDISTSRHREPRNSQR